MHKQVPPIQAPVTNGDAHTKILNEIMDERYWEQTMMGKVVWQLLLI